MKLIIISGAEATGKSTIGRELAKSLGIVYQSKDIVKEALFDIHEQSTWNFQWYERRAKKAFFQDIQQLIETGTSAVIESNFLGDDKIELGDIIKGDIDLSEIHCYTNGLSSFKRVVKRNESKERHPGHHDRRWYPKILVQAILHNLGIDIAAHKPVQLSDKVLSVNTTDISKVNYAELIEFIG